MRTNVVDAARLVRDRLASPSSFEYLTEQVAVETGIPKSAIVQRFTDSYGSPRSALLARLRSDAHALSLELGHQDAEIVLPGVATGQDFELAGRTLLFVAYAYPSTRSGRSEMIHALALDGGDHIQISETGDLAQAKKLLRATFTRLLAAQDERAGRRQR